MKHFKRIAALALVISISACKKEDQTLDKLYSRQLVLEQVQSDDVEGILSGIATATNTSRKDVRKDVDGNDMFLYSNNDVTIFMRRKFDEACNAQGCSWKVDVSPSDTALSEASQKEVVDDAFDSMTVVPNVRSHSNTGG